VKRRDFIIVLGGVAGWPVTARGQHQPERLRRIGVLMGYAEDDPEARSRLAAFMQALAALGWTEGRNLQTDIRWSAGDVTRASTFAKELVALQPEVILSNTTPVTAALQRETRIVPIVFLVVSDPIGSGFVETLAQPGGNITGFINLEASLVEKWLELLKEIAPSVTRVAVMFNPETAPYADYYLQPLRAVAPVLGVKPFTATVRSEAEIEEVISGLAREAGGGLMVMTDSFMTVNRKSIVALTTRYKVPAVSFISPMTAEGGLISYGVNIVDLFQRAASYIDRILRGMKPADLPVQVPTKFELAINLKTAKALGLTVPPALLARADEVIE
jgi:ABC-type uncharacterized transport system substrate-binding protein